MILQAAIRRIVIGEDVMAVLVATERARATLEEKSANKALAEPPHDESSESTEPTKGPSRASLSERRR